MTELLQKAMTEASRLPEAEQDRLGRDLLAHIEKLHELREEVDKGLHSLDAGAGRELDIEAVIARAHRKHAAE